MATQFVKTYVKTNKNVAAEATGLPDEIHRHPGNNAKMKF